MGKSKQSPVSSRQSTVNSRQSPELEMSDAPYELPDGWKWTRLGDVARYINGRAFKPSDWELKGLPIIRIQNLTNPDAKFNYSSQPVEKQYYVQDDDLLISWSATLDAFIWNRGKAILNQHIFRVEEDRTKVEKKFLFFVVRAFLETLKSQVHGTGMQHITRGPFESTRIPLPSLPEQKRIVARIESLFAESRTARDALERIPALLKRFRQSVLASAFRGELTERDSNDEPASVLLARLPKSGRLRKSDAEAAPPDTSDLPELPEGWVWASFGQLVESLKNGIYKPPEVYGSGTPCLRMYNIEDGKIVLRDLKLMRLSKSDIEEYQLMPGDVLVNRVNSRELVGKAAVIPEGLGQIVYESKNIRMRVLRDVTLPEYISYFLQTREARDQIEIEAKQTVGMATVNQLDIATWHIPLAPLAEQRRIVAKIESLFARADAIERAIAIAQKRADKIDQSILARAFRGEL
jgi:type I restriction enzyme, S subunit